MDARLAELLHLLDLERIEVDLFRGESRDIGSPQVFGGQVLGQAVVAATRTVETGRELHSLHAYFLRRGDFNAPIVYQVDRSLDGSSFSNRRVVAIQHGKQIFHLSSSFQVPEVGNEHGLKMPDVPLPESLPTQEELLAPMLDQVSPRVRAFFERRRPFEFRPVEPPKYLEPEAREPRRHVWIRAVDRVPLDETLQRPLLAYVSDYHLLETALLPHAGTFLDRQMASIDHAMWFHDHLDVSDWFLYVLGSPNASGARGLASGTVFSRDGRHVATVGQEGLMRQRTAHSPTSGPAHG
jgi:acyl-CoA thioesterase-2